MIQNVKKELNDKYSFAELCNMASENADFPSIVDAVDNRFLAPKNMTEEIKKYCFDTKQEIPETVGQLTAVIYNSLARCYADCADEIEQFTGKKYDVINIVGGGIKDKMICSFTANATGRKVSTGPVEATSIGNVIVQGMAMGAIKDLQEGRKIVKNSFPIEVYEPQDTDKWNEAYEKWQKICNLK